MNRFAFLVCLGWIGGTAAMCGCTPAPEPVDVTSAPSATVPSGAAPARSFRYPTVDGSWVSDESLRGRLTVIAMVATYDTASQAQTRFVNEIAQSYTPRVNAMLLVLEPPENMPLIEAYASSLGIRFPVAIADAATIAGKGAFPGLHHVPSVVILDRDGHEVWRKLGLIDSHQLREALDGVR